LLLLASAVCYYYTHSLAPRRAPAFARLASTMIRRRQGPHMVGRAAVSALLSAGWSPNQIKSTSNQKSKLDEYRTYRQMSSLDRPGPVIGMEMYNCILNTSGAHKRVAVCLCQLVSMLLLILPGCSRTTLLPPLMGQRMVGPIS